MELRLLGNVEGLVDGERLEVGHARQQCVLVVLLIEVNRVVTVQQFVDRVWADDPPRRAREVVSSYLSRLRKVLTVDDRPAPIRRRSTGYVLEMDESAVDLHLFRELVGLARSQADESRAVTLLERASRLWRGPACAGLDTPWINTVREELERERFSADVDRVDLRLRSGNHVELLPELTARAREHPLDERVAGQLMLALHRGGRQAEALLHYDRLRLRLADELGADPGATLRLLHQRVLTDAAELAPPSPTGAAAVGTTSPGSPAAAAPEPAATDPAIVPRQLPAAPEPFVGRDNELGRLDLVTLNDSTAGRTVVVCALAGAGGMGKTWLTITWAHQHSEWFPDGQLFVDLRGFSPDSQPMEPAVAVRGFLDALGVPRNRVPVDPHAQAALFRSLVANRRMLIVLDNAATTDQVVPLLPGGNTCTVVVTSRHRLPGLITAHGAHHLYLDVLSPPEGRSLLTRRLGEERTRAESSAVDDVILLCGGFPLALGILAARAHSQPGTTLTELVDELRDTGLIALDSDEPAASLPAVLSWSLHHLTAEQRQVFAHLGTAPGPDTGLPAAANLAGLPLARTRALLRGLEDACLVSRDSRGRYRMHDLVRGYAAALAGHEPAEPARQAALRRLVGFYAHTAYTGQGLLAPHRRAPWVDPPEPSYLPHPLPDLSAALTWFDDESPCLLAALGTATSRGWYRMAWQLVWCLSDFLVRRGRRRDHLAVWQTGLDAAEHLQDPAVLAVSLRRLGNCCADLWQHEQAVEHLQRALVLTEQHQDHVNGASTRLMLARSWQVRSWQLQPPEQEGAFRQALEHAVHAAGLFRVLEDPGGEATALNAVGWCATRLGDHDRAREHCQAALLLYRRHPDPDGEADVWETMGHIAHHTGHHREAIDCYQRSLALLDALGYTYHVAAVRDRLGATHAALEQYEQARALWLAALEVYREQHHHAAADRVQRQFDALPRS
ncbi:BTAD domain-containing putative transcriptional regulator [Saccharothrix sp. Mg75]|uniref:AfsR/SARP family transcriptional regulator n=1 Tax=Saccharothrix sp. Mg75 TaxID=3445357 RepID=UPI003EEDE4E8